MNIGSFQFRVLLSMIFIYHSFSTPFIQSTNNNEGSKTNINLKQENLRLKRQESASKSLRAVPGTEAVAGIPEENFSPCCDQFFTCQANEYRTYDGSCNNLMNPFWGAARITYRRLLPAAYEDGYQSPRGYGRSPPLPRSRDVSEAMVNTITCPTSEAVTLMVMQWGQFLDHDMVITINDADSGSPYFSSGCCDDFKNNAQQSPSCFPIDVKGDPFYSRFNVTCLPFVRSSASPCVWQQREQINGVTAYLDGSQVYGSSDSEIIELRVPNLWRLKSGPGHECPSCNMEQSLSKREAINTEERSLIVGCPYCSRQFLPVRNNSKSGNEEFFAGDKRVEEQPGLTSLHTVFVRMHNDVGQYIQSNNPSYSNDKIFEVTRKFVIAVLQQISYDEFLPIVLGETIMAKYKLKLQPKCSSNPYLYDYDPNIDASAQNVLAAAAYRFGHSLVGNTFTMPSGQIVKLAESFNNHQRTTIPGTYPSHFLRGICTQPAEQMDQILVDAIYNKLGAKAPFLFGSDLYARNIERGRDHGIPSYIKWFKLCGGIANEFKDLYYVMPKEVVDKLKNLYNGSLDSIDLFPAGIAENNLPGALVGPTFAHLIGSHFFRLKFGDRYWFENPDIFSADELTAIRQTKLSHVLCAYTDSSELQEQVMLPACSSNPIQNCYDLSNKGIFGYLTQSFIFPTWDLFEGHILPVGPVQEI